MSDLLERIDLLERVKAAKRATLQREEDARREVQAGLHRRMAEHYAAERGIVCAYMEQLIPLISREEILFVFENGGTCCNLYFIGSGTTYEMGVERRTRFGSPLLAHRFEDAETGWRDPSPGPAIRYRCEDQFSDACHFNIMREDYPLGAYLAELRKDGFTTDTHVEYMFAKRVDPDCMSRQKISRMSIVIDCPV